MNPSGDGDPSRVSGDATDADDADDAADGSRGGCTVGTELAGSEVDRRGPIKHPPAPPGTTALMDSQVV